MAIETSGETAYRRIRQDIIFGRLAPAQKLKLDALRASYGASVSTLREVLNRLGSEGFVMAEGQRGFEVEPVSAEGFREVAAMRLLLECHGLEASFAASDLNWEANVIAAHHKLATLEGRMAASDRTAPELWKRYDGEFHRALIAACNSQALLEVHASVYDKYLRYQMVAEIYRGEVAAREHRQLVDCALKRDIAGARALLVKHVQDCVETALARADQPWMTAARIEVRPPAGRARKRPVARTGGTSRASPRLRAVKKDR